MHPVDLLIFIVYFLVMLGVGFFFMRKNKNLDDYYVGGRQMSSMHVGLSVVATDVGGGFSIGLGGLGFMIGLSGSWMLFTGLLGAWLSAVFLIPKVTSISKKIPLFTFPQVFKYLYSKEVAMVAGVISAVGYIGFTSSQILAGAKLASSSFDSLDLNTALVVMGVIAVVYTVMGGLKAVIYTDTIQWIILMSGLIFIGIPIAYDAIGGMDAIRSTLPAEFLSFSNLTWQDILNWTITIVPIWFVGMTLYQRIFACKSEKEAKKAWFVAGLFEWPVMALMGVLLGLFARVAMENGMIGSAGMDPEMGLPLLLKNILPVGLMGLMMSAYFSAIMSTADSCLMAASGNTVTDILKDAMGIKLSEKGLLRLSQWVTLAIGAFAILLAAQVPTVLDLMLQSYGFMVSGLFIPVIGALIWKKSSPVGALGAMVVGGTTTLLLNQEWISLPEGLVRLDLDSNVYGISASLVMFITLSLLFPRKRSMPNESHGKKRDVEVQVDK